MIALTLDTLAKLAINRGDLKVAQANLERAYSIMTGSLGPQNFNTAVVGSNYARVLVDTGQDAKAEPILAQAVATMRVQPHPGNPSVGVAEIRYGDLLFRRKRYQESEGHLLAGHNILVKNPGIYPDSLQLARRDLALVYEALHKPEDAFKFRKEGNALATNH